MEILQSLGLEVLGPDQQIQGHEKCTLSNSRYQLPVPILQGQELGKGVCRPHPQMPTRSMACCLYQTYQNEQTNLGRANKPPYWWVFLEESVSSI